MSFEKVRPSPCEACPYRKDVPSGVWAAHEYDKLRDYDNPTADQPYSVFACHASPEALCHGWVAVHMNRGRPNELLALRLYPVGDPRQIPTDRDASGVELFESGNDAADHGQRDIEAPSEEAEEAQARLIHKHPRLSIPRVTVTPKEVKLIKYEVECEACGFITMSPDYHHAHDLRLSHEEEHKRGEIAS